MTFKTALLGSAAAMFTVAGAQAADLRVAEPVDYVKVCDAFGTGYWYSPGTDWCLKLGGMVRFDIDFGNNVGGAAEPVDADFDHRFQTEYELYFTAKRMTEYGPLTAYIELYGDTGGFGNGNAAANTDGTTVFNEGYVSLGPVLAGYTASILNQAASGTINGQSWDAQADVDQLRLTFALSGWTLAIAAEDYRDRIGNAALAALGTNGFGLTPYSNGPITATGDFPDIVAALTGKILPNATLHVGAGYGDRTDGGVWGAVADIAFDLSTLAPGDRLTIGGAYSHDGGDFVDLGSVDDGDYWSVFGSFTHFWTPGKLSTTIAASYVSTPQFDGTNLIGNITYNVTRGFSIAGEIQHTSFNNPLPEGDSVTTGVIRLQSNF